MADPVDLTLPVNARLFHDAGTIIAVAVEYEGRAGPNLWRDSGSSFTVSVLDELAEGDDAVRWTRRVITWNDSDRGSRLVPGHPEGHCPEGQRSNGSHDR